MPIRITIQVVCDTPEDAQDAVARLTRPRTWVDDVEKNRAKTGLPPFKEDAASEAAPTKASKERDNVSPGEPSIGKIGKDNVDMLIKTLMSGKQPADKWAEHLKLLWKRDLVKFDGEEYYL